MCVDGDLREIIAKHLSVKLGREIHKAKSQSHSGVSKTKQTLGENNNLISETAR